MDTSVDFRLTPCRVTGLDDEEVDESWRQRHLPGHDVTGLDGCRMDPGCGPIGHQVRGDIGFRVGVPGGRDNVRARGRSKSHEGREHSQGSDEPSIARCALAEVPAMLV